MNAWVANFVGSLYDFFDVIGYLIDFAIVCLDGVKLALHLGFEEFVEWLPKVFADEEHWHFWHFAFLHQDENLGEFVKCAEAAREEHIDFAGDGEHYFAGEEIAEFDRIGDIRVDMLLVWKFDI